MSAIKCINCGKPKKEEDTFCPTCTTALKKLPPQKQKFLKEMKDEFDKFKLEFER